MERTAADEGLLAIARMAMDASVRAADDLGGLSPVQLRALTALSRTGGANLGTLAENMGVTVSTASRLVDRLVTAEWVDRAPSPHNGREVSLRVTDAGRSLLRQFDDRRLLLLRSHLARVAPERRELVVAALAEFAVGS
jgi:DNA-binding MarR family transcriptional regulator